MILDNLTTLIIDATKSRDENKIRAYKNLKSEITRWKTSEEGYKKIAKNGGTFTPEMELDVIKTYAKSLEKSKTMYLAAEQTDSVQKTIKELSAEIELISAFLPKEASEQEIINCIKFWMQGQGVDSIDKKQMGLVIKFVKNELGNVNGKLVSDIVKSYM